jgi:hypothetical protein
LIYPDDAKEFSGVMDIVWQSLGRNVIDKNTKQYWFGKLQHLPMGDVSGLFDKWLMTEKELPTVNDILHMAKPREFHKALAAPRNEEVAQAGLKKIEQVVATGLKGKKDYKGWARQIIGNPSAYPDISLRYAQEAIAAKAT